MCLAAGYMAAQLKPPLPWLLPLAELEKDGDGRRDIAECLCACTAPLARVLLLVLKHSCNGEGEKRLLLSGG